MLDTTKLRKLYIDHYGTHYDGCELNHPRCAVLLLCDEVDSLRRQLQEKADEMEQETA